MLKDIFTNLLRNYTDNDRIIAEFWAEIEKNYTHKKRHYHILSHLDNVLTQLTEVKVNIESWESILFTIFYHDIIYNALKSDNEEKSAKLAQKRMRQISVPDHIIDTAKLK